MIWAILALLGVPLWLCALGILALLYRNKSLRQRHGDIPVRVLRAGKTRRTRGHAVWVSDVFAWRGSPAAWNEDLLHVTGARIGAFEPEELKRLHRLGDNPIVATLTPDVGELVAWRWRPNTAQLCLARTARRLAEADPPNLLSELPAAGASGARTISTSRRTARRSARPTRSLLVMSP